jgi:dihydrofolate synthase/folylpolyglutamate synthase
MIWQREVQADGRPWRDYLARLILHGVKLGLENVGRLLDAAGSPQNAYPCVHIAGTNGKGSTAAFLDAMLRAAGCRVGRFTSPHLMDITERFQINGVSIAETELRENIEFFQAFAAAMPQSPTFFEMNTSVAFRWFAQRGVDVAIMETGMGGRYDATNVVDAPVACAITNIDYDHMQYLGGTLGKIAYEKAGILKRNVPCVVGETEAEPLRVIKERAAAIATPLLLAGRDYQFSCEGSPWDQCLDFETEALRLKSVRLGLAGRHQCANAAVAAAVAGRIRPHFAGLDVSAICRGLRDARWPCRLERVLDNPPVLIDVAHNPAGAAALAAALSRAVVVFAVASDKDAHAMLDLLGPMACPLILTAFIGGRSMPVADLGRAAGDRPHETAPCLEAAIARGMALADADTPMLIAGSVYAAGEARRILMEQYNAPAPSF